MILTQEYLKSILDYNHETGIFTWIKKAFSNSRIKIGEPAGSISQDGYVTIKVLRKTMYAHRLAWLFMYGYLPKECIDHINGIRNDNRIINLRPISWHQSHFNQKCKAKHGIKGVTFRKYKEKIYYQVRIKINKKAIHIGYFDNKIDAAIAYNSKAKELFGEYAFLNNIDDIKE